MAEDEDEHENPPLHPIAELAATLLSGGENGEPYALGDIAKTRIVRSLDALFGSIELQIAVSDLIRLACWLDTEAHSKDAADELLEIMKGVIEPLEAVLAEHDPESLTDTKQKFDRFRDEEGGPKAPKVGEDAPKGSVKLGTLDYPKRG